MSEPRSRPWLVPIAIALLAIAAFFAWKHFQSPPPIDAFASGNGRIEATEIDVASKTGGRLANPANGVRPSGFPA